MDITIDIAGDVVERQELLNGTQIVSLEGVSADGAWTMSGSLSWNIGLREDSGEGDLTLSRADGAEIFATLTRADVRDAGELEDADHTLRLEYEIDGGEGEFASATGTAAADGTLSGDAFRGRWRLTLVL